MAGAPSPVKDRVLRVEQFGTSEAARNAARGSDAGCASGSFFRGNGRESAAPGAASAARAGVRISFAGRSGSARRQSGPRNELRHGPSTRIPLPSHAAAAACRQDTGPASHSTRRPLVLPRFGARHRIAPLSRTKPRATTCCSMHARPNRQARAVSRAPQCNGRLRIRPPSRATATWRSVPLRRVDRAAARLRRGTWDTFRCRLTPDTSSGNAPVRRRVSAADSTTPSLIPH